MIEIIEGHDPSSYFWIMPVKYNYNKNNQDYWDNVERFEECEISIEEDIVDTFLYYFLKKHFDETIFANRHRKDCEGFEWYLEYNFYTFEAMQEIIKDIKELVDKIENNYDSIDEEILEKFTNTWSYTVDFDCRKDNDVVKYNVVKEHKEVIIEFYNRFICYIEEMMKKGQNNGYDLISVMGP